MTRKLKKDEKFFPKDRTAEEIALEAADDLERQRETAEAEEEKAKARKKTERSRERAEAKDETKREEGEKRERRLEDGLDLSM